MLKLVFAVIVFLSASSVFAANPPEEAGRYVVLTVERGNSSGWRVGSTRKDENNVTALVIKVDTATGQTFYLEDNKATTFSWWPIPEVTTEVASKIWNEIIDENRTKKADKE